MSVTRSPKPRFNSSFCYYAACHTQVIHYRAMATALVMVVMIVMAFYVIHCKPENADRRNATHASDNQTLRLSDATDYSDDDGDGGGGGGERDANLDEFVRRALSTQSQSVESGDDDLESGTTMENPMRSPGVAAAASGSSHGGESDDEEGDVEMQSGSGGGGGSGGSSASPDTRDWRTIMEDR